MPQVTDATMNHPRELPIPGAAAADERAIELARVWAAGGRLNVTLATQIWEDPANWGLMLVDLARHVSNAYASGPGGMSREGVLERIKSGFDAEWSHPTNDALNTTT